MSQQYQVAAWQSPHDGSRNPEDITFGMMGRQDADSVSITGGTIAGVTVTGSSVAMSPIAAAVSAAGTNQATATVVTAGITVCTTVASGTGIALPPGAPGVGSWVFNAGANAVAVYPRLGGQINALGANTALSVAVGKAVWLMPVSATQWYALLGA